MKDIRNALAALLEFHRESLANKVPRDMIEHEYYQRVAGKLDGAIDQLRRKRYRYKGHSYFELARGYARSKIEDHDAVVIYTDERGAVFVRSVKDFHSKFGASDERNNGRTGEES